LCWCQFPHEKRKKKRRKRKKKKKKKKKKRRGRTASDFVTRAVCPVISQIAQTSRRWECSQSWLRDIDCIVGSGCPAPISWMPLMLWRR